MYEDRFAQKENMAEPIFLRIKRGEDPSENRLEFPGSLEAAWRDGFFWGLGIVQIRERGIRCSIAALTLWRLHPELFVFTTPHVQLQLAVTSFEAGNPAILRRTRRYMEIAGVIKRSEPASAPDAVPRHLQIVRRGRTPRREDSKRLQKWEAEKRAECQRLFDQLKDSRNELQRVISFKALGTPNHENVPSAVRNFVNYRLKPRQK